MKNAVILFTRVPKPGQTKTRLLPVLQPEQCADLHWAFLKDLAALYRDLDAHLFVAYTPDPDWEQLKDVFPRAGYLAQKGNDLGEKMYRAIRKVLALDYESVILTGSDLPAMTADHLRSGFAALEENDIAIGPTSDGGYYLIGMKRPCREVFRIEGYGGASVFENTVAAAKFGPDRGHGATLRRCGYPGGSGKPGQNSRPGFSYRSIFKRTGHDC